MLLLFLFLFPYLLALGLPFVVLTVDNVGVFVIRVDYCRHWRWLCGITGCSISFCPQTNVISSRWIFMARPAQTKTRVESVISNIGIFFRQCHPKSIQKSWNLSACPLNTMAFWEINELSESTQIIEFHLQGNWKSFNNLIYLTNPSSS